jgi:hypothetical protein
VYFVPRELLIGVLDVKSISAELIKVEIALLQETYMQIKLKIVKEGLKDAYREFTRSISMDKKSNDQWKHKNVNDRELP